MKPEELRRTTRRQDVERPQNDQFQKLALLRLRTGQLREFREQIAPFLAPLNASCSNQPESPNSQKRQTFLLSPELREHAREHQTKLELLLQLSDSPVNRLSLLELLLNSGCEIEESTLFNSWAGLKSELIDETSALRLLSILSRCPPTAAITTLVNQLIDFLPAKDENNGEYRDETKDSAAALTWLFQLSLANFFRRTKKAAPNNLWAPTHRCAILAASHVKIPTMPDPFFDWDSPVFERQPRRQFGAHGGDYEFGSILTLYTRLDHRFLFLNAEVFERLRLAINALADLFSLPPLKYCIFAEGYGFGWEEQFRPAPELAESFAAIVNEWHILPGKLEYGGRRPFDVLEHDNQLSERYFRDLMTHSARSPRCPEDSFWISPAMSTLRAIGSGRGKEAPACGEHLSAAESVYVEPGVNGLRKFVQITRTRPRRNLPFSED